MNVPSEFEIKYDKLMADVLLSDPIYMHGFDDMLNHESNVCFEIDLVKSFPVLRYGDFDYDRLICDALHQWQLKCFTDDTNDQYSYSDIVIRRLRAELAASVIIDDLVIFFSIEENKLNSSIIFYYGEVLHELPEEVFKVAVVQDLISVDLDVQLGKMCIFSSFAYVKPDDLPDIQKMHDGFALMRAWGKHLQQFIFSSGVLLDYIGEYNLSCSQQDLYNALTQIMRCEARICINPKQTVFSSRTPEFVKLVDFRSIADFERERT